MADLSPELFSQDMYVRYSSIIRKTLLRNDIPRTDLDDLVQNTFLSLFITYRSAPASFTDHLIMHLAKAQAVSYHKKMSRIPKSAWNDLSEEIPSSDPSPLDLIVDAAYDPILDLLLTDRHFRKKMRALAKKSGNPDIFDFLTGSCIVDEYGNRITSDHSRTMIQIKNDLSEVNASLIHKLADNPSLLYQLTPRQFEEVMAELYRSLNYEVRLTPSTHDGGKDIFLATHSDIGAFLFVVQCKKYAPGRPVGVSVIRELYGMQTMGRYTGSILATTSYFTKNVHKMIEEERLQHQISLQDYSQICRLLKKYRENSLGRFS